MADKRGPGRPAVPREAQRRRLIDAAVRSFSRNDLRGASVSQIVKEAGMSSRSFYECFESREALIEELVRDSGETFIRSVREAFSGESHPASATEELLETYRRLIPVVNLDLARLGGETGQRIRALRREYLERIRDVVIEGLERMADAGLLPGGHPDPFRVELALGAIETLTLRYHQQDRGKELAERRNELLRVLARLVS